MLSSALCSSNRRLPDAMARVALVPPLRAEASLFCPMLDKSLLGSLHSAVNNVRMQWCSASLVLGVYILPRTKLTAAQSGPRGWKTPDAMASSCSRPAHKKSDQWLPACVTSIPCGVNNCTVSALGLTLNTRCNGVEFSLSWQSTSAPRWINNYIDSISPRDHARCNAVELELWADDAKCNDAQPLARCVNGDLCAARQRLVKAMVHISGFTSGRCHRSPLAGARGKDRHRWAGAHVQMRDRARARLARDEG
ncbi:hypothetical protein EDB87DRAFT_870494 [Lactarius vividus]|nr:hypothetical protein EDB87DRAFT_870494 [Lactarius vividus]